MGDIHGMYDYLLDVLQKSGFDYENDQLIQLGDLLDRGPKPFHCIFELQKIKNRILIAGNHDQSFVEYIKTGRNPLGIGDNNGTKITLNMWNQLHFDEKEKVVHFFNEQVPYHITEDKIMFTHGGWPEDAKLEDVSSHVFSWDRELVRKAMSCRGNEKVETLYDFKDIYLGHTTTLYWGKLKPIYSGGIRCLDTGSGKGGPLTIMDIDTHEYWQSDYTINLKDYGFTEETEETGGKDNQEESKKELQEKPSTTDKGSKRKGKKLQEGD